MIWKHITIGARRAAFRDTGKGRLYVTERFGVFEAWVAGHKIGNYVDLDAAKAAAARRVGEHPPKLNLPPVAVAVVAKRPPPPATYIKLDTVVTAPPAELINGGLSQTYQFREPAPHSEMQVDLTVPPIRPGQCKCGARLGRSGKCPALCEPVTGEPPVYDGPRFVGKTHTARLGAPVTW
jgi:hypothetical protein